MQSITSPAIKSLAFNMFRVLSIVFILFIQSGNSFAGPVDLLNSSLAASTAAVTANLQSTAILWLSSFVLIQMVMTNIGLLKSGADIEAIFGKLIGGLMWFGFCFYVVQNGADFIQKVSSGFFAVAGSLSGAGIFDAPTIIGNGASLAANLIAKINQASSLTDLFAPALIGGLMGIVILLTAALIGFKVFLIKIETMLIVMLAPLSFAFLGINALKDQGIAPFKSIISLAYRIVLLGVLLKAMNIMSDNLIAVINAINDGSLEGLWSTVFAATMGYVLLGFLVFKSDSIAASLASGSTSFGTAEVASAAAIGAAVGGAIGAGGDSAKSGATKATSGISAMIKNLSGNSGGSSVSNAGGSGGGSSAAGAKASTMSTSLVSPPGAGVGAGPAPGADPHFGTIRQKGGFDAGPRGQYGGTAQDSKSDSGKPQGVSTGLVTPANGDFAAALSSGVSPSSTAAPQQPATNAGPGNVAKDQTQHTESAEGSGKKATIGDGGDGTAAKPTTPNSSGSNSRKGTSDYMSDLNKQIANEKTSVGVSINIHHSD